MLGPSLAMDDDIGRHLAECDSPLDARGRAQVDRAKLPRAGGRTRAEHDIRQRLANGAGVDLTRTSGLG